MYGVYDTAPKVQDYITAFVNAGLPLVVGEFGNRHTDGDPDEDTIMAFSQANGIGYMGWSWSGNSNRVRYLDMVTDFNPALLTEWGTRIITGANGLQQTSLEASIYGGPTATPCTSCPTPTKTNTPVGPTSTPGPTPTPGGANLALNKPATVSSFYSSSTTGAQAVDGNISTVWRTKKNSGLSEEWISVDLGSPQTFNQVVLKWGGNFPKSYSIRISADNTNWGAIYSTSSGDGGVDTISFSPATARYVQMHSTAWLSNIEHVWLGEFEIY
jgi:mannan endo-1,4-beta-mannosidase